MVGVTMTGSWEAGVNNTGGSVAGVPNADGNTGMETSMLQVAQHITYCWMKWGEDFGLNCCGVLVRTEIKY